MARATQERRTRYGGAGIAAAAASFPITSKMELYFYGPRCQKSRNYAFPQSAASEALNNPGVGFCVAGVMVVASDWRRKSLCERRQCGPNNPHYFHRSNGELNGASRWRLYEAAESDGAERESRGEVSERHRHSDDRDRELAVARGMRPSALFIVAPRRSKLARESIPSSLAPSLSL